MEEKSNKKKKNRNKNKNKADKQEVKTEEKIENKEIKKEEAKIEQPKKEQKKEEPKKEDPQTLYNLPPSLFKITSSNTLDYTQALSKYNLSLLSLSHSFLSNNKLTPFLTSLFKRKALLAEYNLSQLTENFFILYELQIRENSSLTVKDISLLIIIKEFLLSFPNAHLIIQLADDDLYTKGKYSFMQVNNFSLRKFENVLKFLLNKNMSLKNRVHAFSTRDFRLENQVYEVDVSTLKMDINYDKMMDLFNITDDDPISKIDYPCYLACSANPKYYSKYIPSINEQTQCLIINSIYSMNRFQLCLDASKIIGFASPILLATSIVHPLTGTNGYECYTVIDDEHTLLSNDDEKTLKKKILKHSLSGSRGNGTMEDHKKFGGDAEVDISCNYLKFIECEEKYWNIIERFGKGELGCGEVKVLMFETLNDLFREVREFYYEEFGEVFNGCFLNEEKISNVNSSAKKEMNINKKEEKEKINIGNIDETILEVTEKKLKNNPFLSGQEPSTEDAQAFEKILLSHINIDPTKYPYTFAWFSLITLFEDPVLISWKNRSKKN